MSDWNAIRKFLYAVVPWPGVDDPPGHHIGMALQYADRENPAKIGKGFGASRPLRSVQELVDEAQRHNSWSFCKGQFFHTTLQKNTGVKNGKIKAARSQQGAIAAKSLFVDVDLDPADPKKYPDVGTAIQALLEIVKAKKLPMPSAIVKSGGGIHFYWISKVVLSIDVWHTYASGLKNMLLAEGFKFDPTVTADAARVLRIPGTMNHKFSPAKEVELHDMPLKTYDFQAIFAHLVPLAGPRILHSPASGIFADPDEWAKGPQRPPAAFAALTPEALHERDRLDATPILQQCGWYKEQWKTGGSNVDQPQWNLAILGTTFMEKGREVAHLISKGHNKYAPDDTDAMFDRKVGENLGWPKCATIKGAGSTACASCPLFGKINSPLNIRPQITATVKTPPAITHTSRDLPPGYAYDSEGVVSLVKVRPKPDGEKGEMEDVLVPLFLQPVTDFWAQKSPTDVINFTTVVDGKHSHAASIKSGDFSSPTTLRPALTTQRVLSHSTQTQAIGDFFMSMLRKLWNEKEALEQIPFGWFEDNGAIKGFAFGGKIYLDDGTERDAGFGDTVFRKMYKPKGTLQPWKDACAANVTDRKRPEITSIMLMAFAAPLVKLAGKDSVFYSVWGDTASGKSTAYKVGMSVWGDPKKTKGSESSTVNFITTHMAEIRHLPLYWDEITKDQQREKVAVVLHEASDGVEKGRKLSGNATQDRGEWSLPIMAASNGSFVEFLQGRDGNHAASLVRVLEWVVNKVDHGPGHLPDAQASAILAGVERNYGRAGEVYARYLATNHTRIQEEVVAMSNEVQDHFGDGQSAGRIWGLGAAIMILAARYAKDALELDVDEEEIKEFMFKVYAENKANLEERGFDNATASDRAEQALDGYFKERLAAQRAIWTDKMHMTPGKPPIINLLRYPDPGKNMQGGVEIRYVVEDKLIVISFRDMEKWLDENKYSKKAVLNGLKRLYGAEVKEKINLASGTKYDTKTRAPVIILAVEGKELEGALTGVNPELPATVSTANDAVIAAVQEMIRKD